MFIHTVICRRDRAALYSRFETCRMWVANLSRCSGYLSVGPCSAIYKIAESSMYTLGQTSDQYPPSFRTPRSKRSNSLPSPVLARSEKRPYTSISSCLIAGTYVLQQEYPRKRNEFPQRILLIPCSTQRSDQASPARPVVSLVSPRVGYQAPLFLRLRRILT